MPAAENADRERHDALVRPDLVERAADTSPASPTITIDDKNRYINRELSWLSFNMRVLEEAFNANHPVLERLRFLSISANNLDEFYMVRVAGLVGQLRANISVCSQEGMTPGQQLAMINAQASKLMAEQQRCWCALLPLLRQEHLDITHPDDLLPDEIDWLEQEFISNIFPVLTPIAIDPAHPFPFVPNLGFVLCFDLMGHEQFAPMCALLPVPMKIGRFLRLPRRADDTTNSVRFVALEKVIVRFIHHVFPDWTIRSSGAFRVLRDSDVELEEEAEDLVRQFETLLQRRRRGDVIRLKITSDTPEFMRELIAEKLALSKGEYVLVDGILGLAQTTELIGPDRPELQFPSFDARFPERIRDNGGDCFKAIDEKDILVHHPYESFDVVVQFLRQAALDSNVIAIKQTLYRTSKNSPIVDALITAANAGKNVTALIELKARFDEAANIGFARSLEMAGVNVVYGFLDYKTHAKMSLVVRRKDGKTRSYVHIGTGNYHPHTAKVYTDFSLFTYDEAIARDIARVFNFVSGYAIPRKFEKLSASPLNGRERMEEHIDEEIMHAKAGRPASIWAKMNSLVDGRMIDKLYEASQAGVQIDLVVRGVCCLRPGVKGLSNNIRVKSIVGRFLEHSRIVCFGAGRPLPNPAAIIYISSADWMPRNLDRRVEVFCPIENATVHRQVLDQIMIANLKDEQQSWLLQCDGTYLRIQTPAEVTPFNVHAYCMTNPSLSGRGAAIASHAPEQLLPAQSDTS